MTTTKEKLREEFRKAVFKQFIDYLSPDAREWIADFWLDKLSQREAEVRKEIEGFVDLVESMGMDEAKFGDEAKGYNEAITIIKPSITNLLSILHPNHQ